MLRYTGRRPRYPQKKSRLRLLLLLALPGLLIVLLIGSAMIFDGGDETARQGTGGPPLPHLPELSAQQAYPAGPLAPDTRFDRLLLEKSARRLTAYAKDRALRVYLTALGEEPVGPKRERNDKRTPEGRYEIAAKSADIHFYKRLAISYPNEEDRKRAEKQGIDPGDGICIHGLAPEYAHIGQAHRITDWTYGSIALSNEEMDELYRHTPVGAPIEIIP